MPAAEIITIGTELLLGEIVDTNSQYLARALRNLGIDLYRTTTVGDNLQRIAQAIQHSVERAEIVITTGGLGPTVDDPTRQAVALAAGVELEFREELWKQVQARFRRFSRTPTENNRRQAYVPAGAIAVENPVGTAPAFIMELSGRSVISLPGVPREMEHLLEHAIIPYLRQRFDLNSVIKARILHTAGVGESQIDDRIADLEELSNPTVGLAAHSGQVDVRITAKAGSLDEAEAMITGVEAQLRQRLGDWIYGADQETLESAAMQALQAKGWRIAVVEAGLSGELIRRVANNAFEPFLAGQALPGTPEPEALLALTQAFQRVHQAEVGLGVAISPRRERQQVFIALVTPDGIQNLTRPYGGPPAYAARWATHHSLDILRAL
jgi:competence/damage-inducible protein CinA-like protein